MLRAVCFALWETRIVNPPGLPAVPWRTLALGLAVALLLTACGGDSRTLTVFAASSLTDVFGEIGARFQAQHPDTDVRFDFGGSQRLRFQLEQGARADIFASADSQQMNRAVDAGVVLPAPVSFAGASITLVTPASNPAGLQSVHDLAGRRVRLVIAAPAVPAGRLTRLELERLGMVEAVLASLVSEEDNVRAVLTKVISGEADAGFVYRTDALAAADAVVQLRLPGPALVNRYEMTPTTQTDDPALARAFMDFVRSDEAVAILTQAGFLPLPDEGGEG